jgi:lipopolysaccharide biosynthesis glycosyltransferase
LIEIAVADRGTHRNENYFAANKKQMLSDEAEETEAQTQNILDAIEDLLVDSLPETFNCHCGEEIVNTDEKHFLTTLKAHFSTYCPWFKVWRQILLHLPSVNGT